MNQTDPLDKILDDLIPSNGLTITQGGIENEDMTLVGRHLWKTKKAEAKAAIQAEIDKAEKSAMLRQRHYDQKLIAKAVREARLEVANNIWRKYEEQYPDDTETAAWLRSFVVAENITPQHFKEDGE